MRNGERWRTTVSPLPPSQNCRKTRGAETGNDLLKRLSDIVPLATLPTPAIARLLSGLMAATGRERTLQHILTGGPVAGKRLIRLLGLKWALRGTSRTGRKQNVGFEIIKNLKRSFVMRSTYPI